MGFCKLALVCSDIIPKYGRTNGKPREPVPQRRFLQIITSSFSVDYTMNPITENLLHILL